jgi:hypothetical protein
MVRIEFAGTAKSIDKWLKRDMDPFFMLVVTGRSKGNQLSGAKFSVPCVKHTEGANLSPGIWIERLVKVMRSLGIRSGRLFQQRLDPPRMSEWENSLIMKSMFGTSMVLADQFGGELRLTQGIWR